MTTPAAQPPLALLHPPAVRTHCPYCAFQCGMTVRVGAAGETPEIRPDDDFPVNRGRMCIKGFTAGELLKSTERVLQPLVRGDDGRMRTASWEAALDAVADKMLDLRRRLGPQSVGAFGSGALTNEKAYLLGKFVRVALRSPHVDYNGRYCMSSAAAGQNKAFGIDRGMPFPVSDVAQAKTVLLWGSNCADTLPPIMQWFERQKENGGRLIVVDPRRTETARFADLHLQPVPGGDLALANGMLYWAIRDKLVDLEYVERRTVGFDAMRSAALQYDPARVERITGAPASQVREAVRWLAESSSSMILSGRGPEQQSKGVDSVLAMTNLMLCLGKQGRPFSGYGCLTGQGNGQGGREHGQKADQLPGYRLIEDPADRAAVAEAWGVDPAALPGKGKSAFEMLDALGEEGGVHGLLLMGSNVVVASPDARRIEARVQRLEMLAVCDSFLNETSRHAHYFLPVLQWAEEEGTTTNLEGRVILRRRAALPPDGPRSDVEVLAGLAARLGEGPKFAFSSTEAIFEELGRATAGARADYSGVSYAKIDASDGVFWPCPAADHPGTPRLFAERFAHPDGKARLFPVHHRDAGELPDSDYPYYFTTGRWREHYNSGAQTRLVPPLVDARPIPRLQMHPRLAQRLGLVDGGRAIVESRRGRIEFEVSVDVDVRPDVVFAPFHWGGRQAANALTNAALDPTSRMPEFKVCAVRVRGVVEEER